MSNMSYCRFENTYTDLDDCYTALSNGDELSKSEQRFKMKLLELCKDLVDEFLDVPEEDEEVMEDEE